MDKDFFSSELLKIFVQSESETEVFRYIALVLVIK